MKTDETDEGAAGKEDMQKSMVKVRFRANRVGLAGFQFSLGSSRTLEQNTQASTETKQRHTLASR